MSGNDRSSVYGIYSQQFTLPAGVTLKVDPFPTQIGIIFKYESGGSLSVVNGFSYLPSTGASYVTARHYTVGTGEIQNLALSGPIYFVATGATCVFHVERLLSKETLP